MSDLRTAAQQALEALEEYQSKGAPFLACDGAVDALRAALAQQDEPCPNCASLEAQNTELDRKLAELEQAEPEEPVAWRHKGAGHFTVTPLVSKFPEWEPLYLAPPQRKPLAEWQINDLMAGIDPEDVCSWSFRQGVYAAEKHHGIGERP